VLGAACAACRYRDVASHSSFESAGRELNSPSLTQRARNTWLWVDGRSCHAGGLKRLSLGPAARTRIRSDATGQYFERLAKTANTAYRIRTWYGANWIGRPPVGFG
jgi:hypothetical protein